MSEPKTLLLKDPIRRGTEEITELKLRKPKAGDMRTMPTSPNTGDILDLAGRLCGEPPSVINELGMEDMLELLEIVSGFIPAGRQIGKRE